VGPAKKAIAAADAERIRLGADAELLTAALDVHRQLLLRDLLRRLLDHAVAWGETRRGVALGPGEEGPGWTVVARAGAAELEAPAGPTGSVDAERVGHWLAEKGGRWGDDLGPLGLLARPAEGGPAAGGLGLGVRGTGGDLAGALLLLDGPRPEPAVVERIEHLVEVVRPAVDNALRVLSMQELVIRDDTAHCFNRRYFETCLPDELARASRFRWSLSLIFLDMDNLKEVNKRHGHAMGSRTLCEVSRRVRQKIRRFDKLFRFGGDEFCIVLPETEWHGALEVAERVRDAIAGQPFLVKELKNPEGVRMTASLGIASFPLHARTRDELIQHADRAMQRIKSSTKNSIGIAEIVGDKHGR
jgi:diguanylate cyclase (GGDEF)-like protein